MSVARVGPITPAGRPLHHPADPAREREVAGFVVAIGNAFPDILASAQAGDRDAFAAIYRDVAPLVIGYLRSNKVSDAEDVASDVFVSVVQNIASFTGSEHQFRSWLLTITHRRMVDHFRREVRRPDPAEVDESTVVPGRPAPSLEADVLVGLASQTLIEAMEALAPLQRSAIMLRALSDLTVPEVARVMGKPESAVKALLRRATANLARALAETADGSAADEMPEGIDVANAAHPDGSG